MVPFIVKGVWCVRSGVRVVLAARAKSWFSSAAALDQYGSQPVTSHATLAAIVSSTKCLVCAGSFVACCRVSNRLAAYGGQISRNTWYASANKTKYLLSWLCPLSGSH